MFPKNMYPFLQKHGNSFFIRLHRELYKKELLARARKENPDLVGAVLPRGNYYLVDLKTTEKSEYLVFLNYLIGLNQEI